MLIAQLNHNGLQPLQASRQLCDLRVFLSADCLDLCICLQSLGRPAEALPKYETALRMNQRLFPGDHPDVARTLNNVGNCLKALDQPSAALPKFEEALAMRQRLFPGDHPDVALGLDNLGSCLHLLGRSTEALPPYEDALAMRRRVLPPEHTDIRVSEVGLGGVLVDLGCFDEAERLLQGSYAALAASPMAAPRLQERTLRALVKLYEAWGRADQAADWNAAKLSLSQPAQEQPPPPSSP